MEKKTWKTHLKFSYIDNDRKISEAKYNFIQVVENLDPSAPAYALAMDGQIAAFLDPVQHFLRYTGLIC